MNVRLRIKAFKPGRCSKSGKLRAKGYLVKKKQVYQILKCQCKSHSEFYLNWIYTIE